MLAHYVPTTLVLLPSHEQRVEMLEKVWGRGRERKEGNCFVFLFALGDYYNFYSYFVCFLVG